MCYKRWKVILIRGYGDCTSGAEIHLLEGAKEKAQIFLDEHPEAKNYIKKVSDLIFGFETPYDLELLSTVDWVLKENSSKVHDSEFIVKSVQEWNQRKKKCFQQTILNR